MEFQTLTPITRISDVKEALEKTNHVSNNPTTAFADIYNGLIDNYKEAKAVTDEDAIKLATGSIDDLHTVTINAQIAAIAWNLTTTVTS